MADTDNTNQTPTNPTPEAPIRTPEEALKSGDYTVNDNNTVDANVSGVYSNQETQAVVEAVGANGGATVPPAQTDAPAPAAQQPAEEPKPDEPKTSDPAPVAQPQSAPETPANDSPAPETQSEPQA